MNKTETKKQETAKHKERDRAGKYAAVPTHADDRCIPCKEHGKTGEHGCSGPVATKSNEVFMSRSRAVIEFIAVVMVFIASIVGLLIWSQQAYADGLGPNYGNIEPQKCYPGSVFLFKIVKKMEDGLYEMYGMNVPGKYRESIFRSPLKIQGPGMVGGRIKLTGTMRVTLESGFEREVFVFEDCKKGE